MESSNALRTPKKGDTSSKYDYVKVKVRVKDHYYILSRFLISRVLAVTRVPYDVATRVSLDVKKALVDREELDIRQEYLEELLFKLLRERGFGSSYEKRYRMMTVFHQRRIPFLVLVMGPWSAVNSVIATKLAERLNLPSVVRSEIVIRLMQSLNERVRTDKGETEKMKRDGDHDERKETESERRKGDVIDGEREREREEIFEDFREKCAAVREGVSFDIEKCFADGKPFILEGKHLDLLDFADLIRERSVVPLEFSDAHRSAELYEDAEEAFPEAKEGRGLVVPFLLVPSERGRQLYWEEEGGSAALSSKTKAVWKEIEEHLKRQFPPCLTTAADAFDAVSTVDQLHSEVLRRIEAAYAGLEKSP